VIKKLSEIQFTREPLTSFKRGRQDRVVDTQQSHEVTPDKKHGVANKKEPRKSRVPDTQQRNATVSGIQHSVPNRYMSLNRIILVRHTTNDTNKL
jgi:hypothetical protein